MTQLKHDWLTEGIIDFEYKKYILLAYIKDIKSKFNQSQLYPFLSDLIFHYSNLIKIRDSKKLIYENFPQSVSREDFEKLQLSYRKIIEDDDTMNEIEEIISYAIPVITSTIDEGKELYEFVEENLEVSPIGLTPIYKQEGYIFLTKDMTRDISIYRYNVSVFENSNEKFRGISTTFITNDSYNFSRTFENIKLDLAKRYRELPNPASYLIVSKLTFPERETILPVAKRMLIRYVSDN